MHPLDETDHRPIVTSTCQTMTSWNPQQKADKKLNSSIDCKNNNINSEDSRVGILAAIIFKRFPVTGNMTKCYSTIQKGWVATKRRKEQKRRRKNQSKKLCGAHKEIHTHKGNI